MRRVMVLVLMALLCQAVPVVVADPLPLPDPPAPPDDPAGGGDPLEELRRIMKELLPGQTPIPDHCVTSSQNDYDQMHHFGPPVAVSSNDGDIVVETWFDGTHTTMTIRPECLED